jgi:hypothetical protein
MKPNKLTNNSSSCIFFDTRCFPCFNEFNSLFYNNGKKFIPLNVGELLTPIGLAYRSMDDGSRHSDVTGFYLNTQSFTKEENMFLIKILKDRFNLDCTIQKDRKNYRIYIKANSMPHFIKLVKPYFHSTMLYKIS